jgi:ubiquinone/menaquinone biosynthesis C-methylase UbiE
MDKQKEHMKKYWDDNTTTLEKAMYIVNSSKHDWKWEEFLETGKPVWEAIYNSVKEHLSDKASVLDIGCGLGRVLTHTKEQFGSSYGVDINEYMVGQCEKKHKDINFDVVNGTGSLSCFFSDAFSFVYSFICFQHIPYLNVQQNYIREIERVLQTSGIAGLLIQNPSWGNTNNEINLGRGMTLEELQEVTNLKVICKDDNFLSSDGRNYWVILKKE